MMVQKATGRRSARAAHEAEGRVNGGDAGGRDSGDPPHNDDPKATERRSARSLSAGQRPASRGVQGGQRLVLTQLLSGTPAPPNPKVAELQSYKVTKFVTL